MRSIALATTAMLLSVAPALAGPVGSGLGHTQEVARRAAAQPTIQIAGTGQTCAKQAARLIKTQDGVAWTRARSDGLVVAFLSDEHAARQEAAVRTLVAQACEPAAAAN